MNPQEQINPVAINMAKAIRQTESGGNYAAKGASGEFGAYQFTEPTWNNAAKKYGINVPLQSATREQQNEVAVKQINDWITSGKAKDVGAVASMWNAGEGEPNAYLGTFSNGRPSEGVNSYGVKYSVPEYAKSVATAYQTIKQGGQVGIDPNNPSSTSGTQYAPQSNQNGAWFPSSTTDTPIQAGLKTAGNLIPSGINFVKGALDMLNPLSTLNKLSQIPGAYKEAVNANQGNVGKTIASAIGAAPGETAKALIPEFGRQLLTGNLAGAQASVTNDPVGSIAPFLLAGDQVAKFADAKLGGIEAQAAKNYATQGLDANINPTSGIYQGMFDTGVSKVAGLGKVVTTPIEGLTKLGVSVAKGAASHVLGLDPQTMGTIINNREAFTKISQDQISRGSLAEEFGKSIDSLEKTLQETGEGYKPIREMPGQVGVPENFLNSVLQDKFKLSLDADGKIVADTNSITRNKADIAAIQNFVDNWNGKPTLTPSEFLNMRGDLADIAKYDSAKSTKAGTIADQLRQEANRTMRPQIPGLQALDEQFAPRVEQFKQIKKDFLTTDSQGGYVFKDGATNKISNATGVGKDNLLARMEEIHPGITQKIQILKAVEDIQKSYGLKVGNYTRGVIEGGAVLSGNIPLAIMTAILTSPAISVPLLRGLGYTVSKVKPIIGIMQLMAGDVKIPSLITAKTGQEVPR